MTPRRGNVDRTGELPGAIEQPVEPEPHPFPVGDARVDIVREGVTIDPRATPTPERNTPVITGEGTGVRGRPANELTIEQREQLKALAAMQCTIPEIVAFMGVPKATLERNYSDVIDAGREVGKVSLRRAQYRLALAGNVTMLIWLGKQMLGQAEKVAQEVSGPGGGPVQFSNTSAIDVLMTRLSQIASRREQAPTTPVAVIESHDGSNHERVS